MRKYKSDLPATKAVSAVSRSHQFNLSASAVLKLAIESNPKKGRGLRAALAKFIKCQPTHVSHVLSGRYHFTLEQAEAACRYFKFTDEATDYVLLLVNWERAGTVQLKSAYKRRIDAVVQEHRRVSSVVPEHGVLTQEQRLVYYSHWHYGAIHMCLSIERFKKGEQGCQRIGSLSAIS